MKTHYKLKAVLVQKEHEKKRALKELVIAETELQMQKEILAGLLDKNKKLKSIIDIKLLALAHTLSESITYASQSISVILYVDSLRLKIQETGKDIEVQQDRVMERERDVERKRKISISAQIEEKKFDIHRQKCKQAVQVFHAHQEKKLMQEICSIYFRKERYD